MPQANEAFSLYATESPYTTRSLKGKINKRIGELGAELANGVAPNFEGYKHRVGVIWGLREALELLEETEDEGK